MTTEPKALYDATADRWARTEPSSLSDFTGRPAVFELVGSLQGVDVLDAGCGEGYCSRVLAGRGPRRLVGIDVSDEMIARAKAEEVRLAQGIRFEVGDIRALPFDDASFDVAIAVFVFNYLSLADTKAALTDLRRVLRPGGRLVFAVPHPAFPWLRDHTPPFYFDMGERNYFDARDERRAGAIWRRDGARLEVQVVHKTFEDYFEALHAAGFGRMPRLRELRVLPEHIALDPAFFGPLAGVPLHVAFSIENDAS